MFKSVLSSEISFLFTFKILQAALRAILELYLKTARILFIYLCLLL